MGLDTLIKINEPEFKEPETSTRELHPPEPGGADKDSGTAHRSPTENPRLDVLMTFSGKTPILTAGEIGVVAKGDRIQDAFRHLIEATREQLGSSEGERGTSLGEPPYAWFRFVEPEPTTHADEASLADEFVGTMKKLYEFKGDSVGNFLRENPALNGLLFGAYGEIRKHFGSEVNVALEVVADPEALGDRQLFVLIRTELPRKEARARLAELDRGWWLDALPTADGKMEIALE